MTTKAAFMTAMGGSLIPIKTREFVRTAGNVCTATAHGMQTGMGPFKVMTTNSDAPSGITAAVQASLVYTPATDIQDETVSVNGKTYTWRDAPSTDGQVDVNADDTIAAENLAAAINLGLGASTKYGVAMTGNPGVYAVADASTVTVFAKSLDSTVGNAIVTAEAAAGAWAGGAVLLAGGVTGTDYYIITLTADTFSLATTKALAIAGTAVTLADAGTGCHMLVTTVETLAAGIEDSVERLTSAGVRVYPALDNVADMWQTMIDGVAN